MSLIRSVIAVVSDQHYLCRIIWRTTFQLSMLSNDCVVSDLKNLTGHIINVVLSRWLIFRRDVKPYDWLILCDCCFNIKWSEFIYIRDKHKVTNIKVTRAMQSVAYPLAVKPLKISKFNCDLDLWPLKSIGC